MVKKIEVDEGITLVAVSKTRPLEDVVEAYNLGYRTFGENHVQEIVEKFSVFKPADLKVHMIGHLQSNKVKKVVPLADMIQSVDSFELLSKIDTACAGINKKMPVLLEVNTSGEEAKSGFDTFEQVQECVSKAGELKNIEIKGLMTVGPVACEPEEKDNLTRKSFALLREYQVKLKKLFPKTDFEILSMGMSSDWHIAVEEGSTMVRIGTAIFGERHYD